MAKTERSTPNNDISFIETEGPFEIIEGDEDRGRNPSLQQSYRSFDLWGDKEDKVYEEARGVNNELTIEIEQAYELSREGFLGFLDGVDEETLHDAAEALLIEKNELLTDTPSDRAQEELAGFSILLEISQGELLLNRVGNISEVAGIIMMGIRGIAREIEGKVDHEALRESFMLSLPPEFTITFLLPGEEDAKGEEGEGEKRISTYEVRKLFEDDEDGGIRKKIKETYKAKKSNSGKYSR